MKRVLESTSRGREERNTNPPVMDKNWNPPEKIREEGVVEVLILFNSINLCQLHPRLGDVIQLKIKIKKEIKQRKIAKEKK